MVRIFCTFYFKKAKKEKEKTESLNKCLIFAKHNLILLKVAVLVVAVGVAPMGFPLRAQDASQEGGFPEKPFRKPDRI